jgi:hypothetical protein
MQSKHGFKTATKVDRVSAAIVPATMTLSLVWAMSDYAYPGSPASWLGQMAKRTTLQSGS